jgi:Kef-type K+ transport system membrane component KefB
VEDYTTLILVGLVVLAFLASRLLHGYAERVGLVSGIEYAVVGVLIGPQMPWSLLDADILLSLDLLISLLLGLLGFMVGLHAREALRRFEHFLAGSLAALAVAVAVGLAVLGLIQWIEPVYLADPVPMIEIPVWADGTYLYQLYAADDALWLALTLGAAAAIASSTAIRATAKRWKAEGPPVVLLADLAAAGQVIAIMLFGLALAGDRAIDAADSYGLSLVEWALLIGAAGAVTGLLFMIFIGGAEDDLRLYLATIGVVIFAAGIGAALGISPLFVNLIAGLTVAATSAHGDRLRKNLDSLRRPVSILLLVFAGLAWRPVGGWLWLIPAAYLLTRVGARLLATRWAVSTFVHGVELRRVGGGLIGQGSLAAAIALSYAQGHPDRGHIVLSAVLLPMLVTDLFAARTLRRVLANAGAIRPRAKLQHEQEPGETLAPAPRERVVTGNVATDADETTVGPSAAASLTGEIVGSTEPEGAGISREAKILGAEDPPDAQHKEPKP